MRKHFAGVLAAWVVFALLLPAAENAAEVETLVQQLENKDPIVRLKAAKMLGKLGPRAKEALPALTDALKDKDSDVRAVVRNAIERIKAAPEKANPKLEAIVKDLKNKSPTVRLKAAARLGGLGEEGRPIGYVLTEAMMDTYPRYREKYFDALEKIDGESHKLVLAFLTETDPDKKLEAIDGMESLGEEGKACVPVLLKIYYRDKAGRLTKDLSFAQKIVPALVKLAPDDKNVAQAVLAAVTTQGGRLPFDSPLRAKAIEAAGDLKTDAKTVARALVMALNDPNCRVAAIQALSELGKDAKDAAPVLMKLKFDMNKEVREAAAKALDLIKE